MIKKTVDFTDEFSHPKGFTCFVSPIILDNLHMEGAQLNSQA